MSFVRSLVVWLLFIVAESLNGTIRNLWLIPTLGDRPAHLISFVTGSILILTIATLCIRRLNAQSAIQLLRHSTAPRAMASKGCSVAVNII